MNDNELAEISASEQAFSNAYQPISDLIGHFTHFDRASSDTFKYWANYLNDYSQLLFDYLAANRDDDKDIEYEWFA